MICILILRRNFDNVVKMIMDRVHVIKRSTIIKGDYEPNDEECEWPSESEDEEETALAQEVNEKAKLTEEEKKAQEEKDKDVKGIPHFWLTIFKNVELIADMIQEPDEPALEALKDVTVTFTEVKIFALIFDR